MDTYAKVSHSWRQRKGRATYLKVGYLRIIHATYHHHHFHSPKMRGVAVSALLAAALTQVSAEIVKPAFGVCFTSILAYFQPAHPHRRWRLC